MYRLQPVFSEPPEGGTPTITRTQTFLEPQYLEEPITNCNEPDPFASDIAIILKLLRNLFQLRSALPRAFLHRNLWLFIFFRVPHFTIAVDVICRGGRINIIIMAAEFFVELKDRLISAERKKAVQSVFNVMDMTTTGAHDGIQTRALRRLPS